MLRAKDWGAIMSLRDAPTSRETQRLPFIRRAALRLALVYAIISLIWITFSDRVAEALAPTPQALGFIESTKGWLFVMVTGVGLYFLFSRILRRVHELDTALSRQNLAHQIEMGNYRLLLEAAEDNIILFDRQKCYLAITDRGAAIMGHRAADMQGRRPTEVLDIQLGAAIEDTLEMVMSTQKPLQGTWKMHADNQQRWFEVRSE